MSCPKLKMIIHAFVSSRLESSNALYTRLSKTSLERLQIVQNAVARLLTKSSKFSHANPILMQLHWLPVYFTVQFKILWELFMDRHQVISQGFCTHMSPRSCDQALLMVPPPPFWIISICSIRQTYLCDYSISQWRIDRIPDYKNIS